MYRDCGGDGRDVGIFVNHALWRWWGRERRLYRDCEGDGRDVRTLPLSSETRNVQIGFRAEYRVGNGQWTVLQPPFIPATGNGMTVNVLAPTFNDSALKVRQ